MSAPRGLRTLTYWCCESLDGDNSRNLRAHTLKEAKRLLASGFNDPEDFSAPFKVTVKYANALDLVDMAFSCAIHERKR